MIELARYRREIPRQQVRRLAHHPAAAHVGHDPIGEHRVAQQGKRVPLLHRVQRRCRVLRRQRLLDCHVLQAFQFQQHAPKVALHDVVQAPEFDSCLLHERLPLLRAIHVKRIDVIPRRRFQRNDDRAIQSPAPVDSGARAVTVDRRRVAEPARRRAARLVTRWRTRAATRRYRSPWPMRCTLARNGEDAKLEPAHCSCTPWRVGTMWLLLDWGFDDP